MKLSVFFHKVKGKLIRYSSYFVSDELYLKMLFKHRVGYSLNLDNPRTFCEKLQWLKLNDKHLEYTKMVDKVAAKDYVASVIGNEYIIPTYGVWDNVDAIEWAKLPKQFVIKVSHDSGGVVICRDKSRLDINHAKKKLQKGWNRNFYNFTKEYPYRNVKPRVIAEKLLVDEGHIDLPDYKFFCFNGKPKFCQVIRDRNTKETIDFYDMEWKHQEFYGLNPVARPGAVPVARPVPLEEICDCCKKLAAGIPFLRVDFYVVNNKPYFGELTFFPLSGLGCFTPRDWDLSLGEMIMLKYEND